LRSKTELCTFYFGTHWEANVTTTCCPVVELRQYTLRPGRREVLIELFDRALAEPQEAVGMEIIGQFRDLDRDDRFVWLRGFPDMERRRRSLEAFYGGPVWRTHSHTANATMVDVDDVLLLRPVTPSTAFPPLPSRPEPTEHAPATTLVATICPLDAPADTAALASSLLPALAAMVSPALAAFVEEPSENTFPTLPVRSGEHVVVWLQRTERTALDTTIAASSDLARVLVPGLVGSPAHLRLEPTARSRLR
jgi:NIPSNAP